MKKSDLNASIPCSLVLLLCAATLSACKANKDDMPAVESKTESNVTAAENIKKNTASFLRENESLLLEKHADFDSDGLQDTIAVAQLPVDAVANQQAYVKRRLLVLHNTKDGLQLLAENEKLIACSKCGQQLDDPFASRDLQLKDQTLIINQTENNAHPYSSSYEFKFDTNTKTWQLSKGTRTRQEENDSGDWVSQTESVPVTPVMDISKVDGKWAVPQYWNAVVVNKETGSYTSFFNLETESALQLQIDQACKNESKCDVLTKTNYGCVVIVQDDKNQIYAGGSGTSNKTNQALSLDVMNRCKAANQQGCKEILAECSVSS
jgi:hypothetical protein